MLLGLEQLLADWQFPLQDLCGVTVISVAQRKPVKRPPS